MRHDTRLSAPAGPVGRRSLLRTAVIATTGLAVARASAHPDIPLQQETQPVPEILHLIKIRAAQDKVFQAVSTADDIRGWWTRDAVLDPRVGGTGEFGFYGHRMVINVRVAALAPPGHAAWDVLSSTGGAFDGTTISFDLTSADGITSLLFAHRGFKPEGNNIPSATTRWGFYLLSLKRYVETGTGTPNPEDTELIR